MDTLKIKFAMIDAAAIAICANEAWEINKACEIIKTLSLLIEGWLPDGIVKINGNIVVDNSKK